MKKLLPIVLMLSFLLSGCGLAEQAQKVKETYINPALESAGNQTGEEPGALIAGPDVSTHIAAVTDFVPVEDIGSRLSDDALTELTPSAGYGTLLPYIGAYYYSDDGIKQNKYGLVTGSGKVVLDPVLTTLELASLTSGGETVSLGIYIMGKYVEGEEGAGDTMYAVAGKDGSWAAGFDYSSAIPMELGVLCIIDEETNAAVCYDETGAVVFDTRNFSNLSRLKANSISNLADCSGGFMRICYTNGQYGFIDKNGSILNKNSNTASYFDDVRSFSEGYAAVKLYDNWNYIGTDGYYSISGQFEEAGDFENGVAVVKKDGVLCVIDTSNKVLKEFPDAVSVTSADHWVCAESADGTMKYYITPSMEEANLYGMELHMCAEGYWVIGETGVRIRTFGGEEIYFSGAVEFDGSSGDGLYLVKLADGSMAVTDANSRVVVTGDGSIGFVQDSETGETYIYEFSGVGGELFTSSGTLAADGVILRNIGAGLPDSAKKYYGPDGGLVMCADEYSSGLKNISNEWVFRIKADSGD